MESRMYRRISVNRFGQATGATVQPASADHHVAVLIRLRNDRRARALAEGLGLLLLFALAFVIRVHNIGRQSLWLDEAVQVWYSSLPIHTIITLLPQNDVQPPLYFVALHGWITAFGQSEEAVRLFSAISGALALPLLYLVGRTLAGRWVATLAALFVIVNPFDVWYSQEARAYATMATLALCAIWLLLHWVRTPRWGWGVPLLLADAFLLYTQSTTFLLLAAQAAYVAVVMFPRQKHGLRHKATSFWPLVGAFALWLPWVPALVEQTRRGETNWIPYATLGDAQAFFLTITGLDRAGPLSNQGLLRDLILGLLLLGAVVSLRRGWREALLLLSPAVVLFVLSTHTHSWAPRAVLFAVFGFALLVARVLARFPRPVGLVALLLLVGHDVFSVTPAKEPWRAMSTALCAHARPGDVLYVTPEYALDPLAYYTTAQTCPSLILTPRQPLPTTRSAFLDAVFARPGVEGRAMAWLSGRGTDDDKRVDQSLIARHARIWSICRYQGPGCPDWRAFSAFTLRPTQGTLFDWQGGIVVTSATIEGPGAQ